jgi:hypothetical protein
MDEKALIRTEIEKIWRAKPRLTPSQWCEQNLVLPQRVTPHPGPLTFDRHPFWREPLDCMGDPTIEEIVCPTSTQIGKTTFLSAAIAYAIVNLQWPILYIMPSEPMARSFSESRLQPFLEASECMAQLMPKNRDRYKILEMHFSTCTLNLVGANSPSNIASRPVGLLALDETDKYPVRNATEGSAINLALERTKAYPGRRKHLIVSSPTRENGAIWQFFLPTDRREYHLPSPHDKDTWLTLSEIPEFETIRTKTGKIDIAKTIKTATVRCPKTGQPIADGDKWDMLRAGKWVPQNPESSPKKRGYHLTTLYSCDFTWSDIVEKYLVEKSTPFGTQNFANGWMGRPYEDSEDVENIEVPHGSYLLGDNHDGETVRVMAVDVQRDHFFAVVRAVVGAELRLIARGKILTFEDIEAFREKHAVEADLVGIDSGYNSNEVKAQAAKYGWTCLKGESNRSFFWHQEPGCDREKKLSSPANPELAYHAGGVRVPVIQWSAQAAQDMLQWYMSNGHWTTAVDAGPDYEAQMKSHHKVEKQKGGRTVYFWERIGRMDDHYWDCETMAIVLLDCIGFLPHTAEIFEESET